MFSYAVEFPVVSYFFIINISFFWIIGEVRMVVREVDAKVFPWHC